MAREVKRFGSQFCVREEDTTDDWEIIEMDDVTPEELAVITDHEARLERIRRMGYDPQQPPVVPFAKIILAEHPDNTATDS